MIKANTKRNSITLLLLVIGCIALISFFMPSKSSDSVPSYEEGKPWMHPMLTAKISVPIPRSDAEVQRITDSIKANMLRYYKADFTMPRTQVAALTTNLRSRGDIAPMVRQKLIEAVAKAYNQGIVDDESFQLISSGKMENLLILNDNNTATTTSTQDMKSAREAYMNIYNTLNSPDEHDAMVRIGINGYLQPNVTYDSVETNKKFESLVTEATAPTGMLQPGQSIIYPGTIVDAQKSALLKAYDEALKVNKDETIRTHDYSTVANAFVVAAMMLMFLVFMRIIRSNTYADTKHMVFIITFITVSVIIALIMAKIRTTYLYIMPFAIVPLVVTTFTDSRIGFFSHLVTILICSIAIPERQAEFITMQVFAGVIAVASMRGLLRRSQLVRCALFIFLSYSVMFVGLCLAHNDTGSISDWHFFLYFAINSIALSFSYMIVFLEEKLFGFTSTLTLVELGDSNTPALRELSKKCPGTFQHSFQVANLATEVAHNIGANVPAVRAGALYHDIGKTRNPAFFTENQTSVNPHLTLQPRESASIVIAHVTDGLKLAQKYKLPQVIKDAIAQHHGKGMTRYFYTMECKAHPNEEVDPAPFTYPGPNPQSKETAILMMCDACEAATKSLKEPNEKNISAMVNKVIDSQIADGLLSEAPISFLDIATAKETIIKMLRMLYLPRISYPDDIKPKKKNSEEEPNDNAAQESKQKNDVNDGNK